MSRQHSPFAGLSSRQQQERWLEFQNSKLPYIRGEFDTGADKTLLDDYMTDARNEKRGASSRMQDAPRMNRAPEPAGKSPMQQMAEANRQAVQSFQKTNHKQYDAVIRRMKDAGKQANQFQPAH